MAKRTSKNTSKKTIETFTHKQASRKNIPTAEFESVLRRDERTPIRLAYERRNRDLDPQLVWRGKDEQDWSDLVVHAPALYIQEKVHPKVLIDDLVRQTREREEGGVRCCDRPPGRGAPVAAIAHRRPVAGRAARNTQRQDRRRMAR